MKRVLILGGNGRIGQAAIQAIRGLHPEWEVIGTQRSGKASEPLIVFNPFMDDWSKLGKFDVLVNAIGAAVSRHGQDLEEIHVGLALKIIENRALLGSPRVIHVSALGAIPGHATAFLDTKGRADRLFMEEADTVVVRPSIVCTPGTMLYQRLSQLVRLAELTMGKLLLPAGLAGTRVQPVLQEEVAEIIARLCDIPLLPAKIDVVGPQAFTYRELLQHMAAPRGIRLKVVEVPKAIVEGFVNHFMGFWMPNAIPADLFGLLFEDNAAEVTMTAQVLGRIPADTIPFWQGKFGAAETMATQEEMDPMTTAAAIQTY